MIRLIIKTLWHQRRKNAWILIEMILVGFFLWKAVGDIFNLEYKSLVPFGYNEEGVYRVELGEYGKDNNMYNADADNDNARTDNIKRIISTLRQSGEMTDFFVLEGGIAVPNSDNFEGTSIMKDTTDFQVQLYTKYIFNGSDMFKTYQIHDAYSDGILKENNRIDAEHAVYISKSLADKYFGGINPVGKSLKVFDGDSLSRVAGVFKDFKASSEDVPGFMAIKNCKIDSTSLTSHVEICFRVKEDMNEKAYIEHFSRSVAPLLSVGNYYMLSVKSLKSIREDHNQMYVDNKLHYNILMSVFFMLCTFIGILGTFWIRSNNRRGEIGVMKSMGCTRRRVIWQFVMESFILTTIAFLLAMIWRFNVVYGGDFFNVETMYIDSPYLIYHPAILFIIYSVITYIIMLVIALIGTVIPVIRAARTLPAKALREL
jgi:putative ABC transport system permease protein